MRSECTWRGKERCWRVSKVVPWGDRMKEGKGDPPGVGGRLGRGRGDFGLGHFKFEFLVVPPAGDILQVVRCMAQSRGEG